MPYKFYHLANRFFFATTEDKKGIQGDIRDIFAEAKGAGFDVKAMRTILKLRKMNAADREEAETIVDIYRRALDI